MLYRFDEFELDTGRYELRRDGTPCHVERLVFDLLAFLVRNPGRILGREEVVDQVWQGRAVSDATISGCIKSARRALGDSGDSRRAYIRTIRGRGFEFTGAVTAAGYEPRDGCPRTCCGVGSAAGGVDTSLAASAWPRSQDRSAPGTASIGRQTGSAAGPRGAALHQPECRGRRVFRRWADGGHHHAPGALPRPAGDRRGLHLPLQGPRRRPARRSASGCGPAYVVQGSVRRPAGRVRISAQLVDARERRAAAGATATTARWAISSPCRTR